MEKLLQRYKLRARTAHVQQSYNSLRRSASHEDGGFTLIEVIVVVLMIAILSAIAAPSWMGFVNNQRASKVNDAVLSAIQEAQREAKSKKLSYGVSFRIQDGIPQFAIYPADKNPESWRSLTGEVGVNKEQAKDQIWLGTNLDQTSANTAQFEKVQYLGSNTPKVVFDQFGNLPKEPEAKLDANNDNNPEGLIVAVAASKPDDHEKALEGTIRCVKVTTLLGSLQTGRGKYDATNNKQGCPLP